MHWEAEGYYIGDLYQPFDEDPWGTFDGNADVISTFSMLETQRRAATTQP